MNCSVSPETISFAERTHRPRSPSGRSPTTCQQYFPPSPPEHQPPRRPQLTCTRPRCRKRTLKLDSLDVYQPVGIGKAPLLHNRPAIVIQEGGAWVSASKTNGRV